jgi:hypothetical protein
MVWWPRHQGPDDDEEVEMKLVLDHIGRRMHELMKHPWYAYLRDETLTQAQRFAWAPCIVPFIMAYRDFTVEVIRGDPSSTDPFKQALYTHSYEEDFHWHWMLEDLQKLGFDPSIPMTETVRFLWSADCRVSRSFPTRLAAMCGTLSPRGKFCVVEACETISTYASKIFKQVQGPGEEPLRFFGAVHWEAETAHACHQMSHTSESSIKSVVLDEAERAQALSAVDETFNLTSELYSEWLAFGRKFSPGFRGALDEVVQTSLRDTQARVSEFDAKRPAAE